MPNGFTPSLADLGQASAQGFDPNPLAKLGVVPWEPIVLGPGAWAPAAVAAAIISVITWRHADMVAADPNAVRPRRT
jgi:hypothetical protein